MAEGGEALSNRQAESSRDSESRVAAPGMMAPREPLEAAARSRFLLDASRLLLESLEYEVTLSRLAQLTVPRIAELCVIELSGDDGTSAVVEVAHADGVVRARVFALFRDEKSLLEPSLESLGVRSVMVLPMVFAGRTLGTITLGLIESRCSYDAADREMAEELAERTAMAVANGRSYLTAKNAVQSREDLLGIVSHDLRNPLNVTLMKCAMMLRDAAPSGENERLRRDVLMIERSARRMDRLLHDLHDFATIQTGHLSIEQTIEPVADMVAEVLESARAVAGKRPILAQTDGVGAGVRLRVDRERFLQICANLIGNALKFTPEPGVVLFEASVEGSEARFAVQDTGCGIAPDELPYVFQKHWRARTAARGGIGLGLFIARALVMEHGGRIWAESQPGKGSRFTFTLPLGEKEETVDNKRILVVDDDAELRREIGEVLAAEGHPVAFAADGRKALAYLRSHPRPSLVLLDMMMPVMDGWEFFATVRADPELADLPIVVLSCLDRPENDLMHHAGARFLKKPIQLDKLFDTLKSLRPGGDDVAAPTRAPE
jgi:signal transduction histidine kinase/ActR/RegA family two-component response regulator